MILVAHKTDTNLDLETAEASLPEREARLFARFLHNGILQDLAAAGLHLHAIARSVPETEAGAINDVLDVLRSGQRGVRQLVEALEVDGFDSPTVTLADALSRGDATKWVSAVRPEGARVTGKQAGYLIELLNGFADLFGRQSGAGQFRVEIVVGPIVCCELVAGAGAAPEPSRIATLQQRVREFGGTVEMTSDNEGRSITVSFPRER